MDEAASTAANAAAPTRAVAHVNPTGAIVIAHSQSKIEIYLLDEKRILRGAVSLSRLVVALPDTRLSVLAEPRVLSSPADLRQNDLAELFDKYNLRSLPVVDHHGHIAGVIHAEQVIAQLREG